MAIHPDLLDEAGAGIHYREYKILLKAERFDSSARFTEFGRHVEAVAKHCEVKYHELPPDPHIREVHFFDTVDYDMYNSSFILRKRHRIQDGFPVDEELAFKFRHTDRELAASINVSASRDLSSRIKFKEEILLDPDNVGGFRSIFSHNFVAMNTNVAPGGRFADLIAVFGVLEKTGVPPEAEVRVVNDAHVAESSVDLAELDFGNGFRGKANVAVWRQVGNLDPLVGEFAYQCKFKHYEDISPKAMKKSEKFYSELQHRLKDWIERGTTKTALIYKLGSKPVKNAHE